MTAPASTQHRNARIAIVAPIAHRRPWLNRSRNGPISGATIANGSIVRPRNSATWPRASPVGTWKNRVPASEIATAASPAALNACSSISRERPESPAPSAWEALRATRYVARPARAVPRATARAPRPPARRGSPGAVRRVRGPASAPAEVVRIPPALATASAVLGWLVGHAAILPGGGQLTPRPGDGRSCPGKTTRVGMGHNRAL